MVFNAEGLISQAIDKNIAVEALERLLAMRRELKAEYAKEDFIKAMADFQSECPIIEKTKAVMNKGNTSIRYKFAPMDDIIRAVKDLLKKHGFSYAINCKTNGMITAICTVTHIAGHSEQSEFTVPIDKDAFMSAQQQYAAALTYAKRYSFCNAFGIMTGEDDNDAAPQEEEVKFDAATFNPETSVIIWGKKYKDKKWSETDDSFCEWVIKDGQQEIEKQKAKATIEWRKSKKVITPNEKPTVAAKPAISDKNYAEAKKRLSNGEVKILNDVLTNYSLTQKQNDELVEIHASLHKPVDAAITLTDEIKKELTSQDALSGLNAVYYAHKELHSLPAFNELFEKCKMNIVRPKK